MGSRGFVMMMMLMLMMKIEMVKMAARDKKGGEFERATKSSI